MTTLNATAAPMAHAHGTGMTMATGGGHNHGGKADPQLPNAHDPRFMDLTVGRPDQAKSLGKYVQAGGPGYGGREGENVNNQKDKNEIIDKTDANHLPQYGVLPGQNYVQAIQSYTGLSAIKDLAGMQGFPLTEQDWNAIVALQDRGGSPVLKVVNYLTGLSNERPADLPASIAAKRDAVANFQVPGAGKTVAQITINPKDVSGNNIARSHHSADWFGTYRKAIDTGIPAEWAYAMAFSDDGTSGSGRFNGFNNQDGNSTGANDGENAYFKMVALASQQLGRPDLFYTMVAGGHAHTALDPSVKTKPKINELIGWNPPNDDTMSPERVEAIRQYYLRGDVQVNEGDFKRHVGSLPDSLRSQLDFSGVQFEPKEANNGGGGNDGGGETEAAGEPTGAGTGANPAAVGGGPLLPEGPGSPTIDTRPTLDTLGLGGPFPVIDPATNKLNKRLQEQLMTAFVDMLYEVNNSAVLGDEEERSAFVDGAKKGATFLKDAVAVDPEKVAGLKEELATALADGNISDEERASLSQKLAEAGMADVAKAVADGTATDKEIATLQEQVDGAASTKLERDVTAALEDGTLTPEERATIESRLGKSGLDELEKGLEDGSVTKEELEAISQGVKADATAGNGRPDKAPDATKPGDKPAGTTDSETGAQLTADGQPADPANPNAGQTDAQRAATGEETPAGRQGGGDGPGSDKPAGEGETAGRQNGGDAPAGDKPAGDKPQGEGADKGNGGGDKPAGDKPAEDKPADQPAAA